MASVNDMRGRVSEAYEDRPNRITGRMQRKEIMNLTSWALLVKILLPPLAYL
jgi:hypothetical protein